MHDIQGMIATLSRTGLLETERLLAQAKTQQDAINRALGHTGSGTVQRVFAQAETQQEVINRALGITESGAAERTLAQAETQQEGINKALGITQSSAAARILAQAETRQEVINRTIGITGLGARAEDYLKRAERQAAIISSKMLVPETHQELIDQALSIKAFSQKDPNYSTNESYDKNVALLSKSMLDSLPSKNSSNDDDVEISQLLIGAALTVVSDFIDADSANDSFFSKSVIDAGYLFKTIIYKDDDSPDEIIEAYCDWIREYADSVKNDMSPKDTFIVVLTLVLFLLSLCF